MTITVNGESMTIEEGKTLHDLVNQMGLGKHAVAVEKNLEVIPRRLHESTPLSDGDTIEVVTLVGGG